MEAERKRADDDRAKLIQELADSHKSCARAEADSVKLAAEKTLLQEQVALLNSELDQSHAEAKRLSIPNNFEDVFGPDVVGFVPDEDEDDGLT